MVFVGRGKLQDKQPQSDRRTNMEFEIEGVSWLSKLAMKFIINKKSVSQSLEASCRMQFSFNKWFVDNIWKTFYFQNEFNLKRIKVDVYYKNTIQKAKDHY